MKIIQKYTIMKQKVEKYIHYFKHKKRTIKSISSLLSRAGEQ